VIFGTERFAICPLCTQSPPRDVFQDEAHRRRCLAEVRRLQRLFEQAQSSARNKSRRRRTK
jgi:hypothetical protein